MIELGTIKSPAFLVLNMDLKKGVLHAKFLQEK